MEIKGFIENSMVDWDGRIVSTIFTPNCNFRCPFCHNHQLILSPGDYDSIPEENLLLKLRQNLDFLDGVCITGGEPTLQEGLTEFCKKVKGLGLKVKLDTNGTNPGVIEELIERGLIDYIAMDIKAPLVEDRYREISRNQNGSLINDLKRSISIIMNSGLDYEFRTTVIPGFHSEKDISDISREISGSRKYILQKFNPENAMDDDFKKIKPDDPTRFEKLADTARNNIILVKVRGKSLPKNI